MKVGFTGTRNGMTAAQSNTVANLLRQDFERAEEGHHGDCVGADADFHHLASPFMRMVIHPGPIDDMRAHCYGFVVAPKSHFARNRDIVDECDVLIATPWQSTEPVPSKGGTWYTVGYARKRKRPVFIVWPDGSILVER